MTIPFNKIVKFGQSTMLEKDLFNVSWILSRFCNYNCSYCWPYAHSNKPDHRPLEQYKKTKSIICCEVNIKPINTISLNFHSRFNFLKVGEKDFLSHKVRYLARKDT